MLKNKFLIALCILGSMVFAGCDSVDDPIKDPIKEPIENPVDDLVEEPDGLWPAIEITVNGDRCESSTFNVSQNGGEYKLFSNNYGELWLNAVAENENVVWPEEYNWSGYKSIHLTKEWYEVQYDKSGNIVVVIRPKEDSTAARKLTFMVECGDAFGSVTLLQE